MPQVPLPRVGLSAGATPSYTAPRGVVPMGDVAGQQLQQFGGAMSQLSSDVGKIAVTMGEEFATASANEGLNMGGEYADEAVREWQSRLGSKAFEVEGNRVKEGVASGKVVESVQARMREIEARIPSNLGKEMFRQKADGVMGRVKSQVYRHEANQINIYRQGQAVGSMNRHMREAINE